MKRLPNIAIVGLMLLMAGCASFQSTAGKTLATTVQTVDAAMQGWAAYVVIGNPTPQQQAAVKTAYQKYQAAEAIAEKAYVLASASGDQSGWTVAASTLRQCQADLLLLISTFNTKGANQ